MTNKKERATSQVRIYPSTHRRLKIAAASLGLSFAALLDLIEKKI